MGQALSEHDSGFDPEMTAKLDIAIQQTCAALGTSNKRDREVLATRSSISRGTV